MSSIGKIDRLYFEQHPQVDIYYRQPEPHEFAGIPLPEGCRVAVHKINERARVRALEDGAGNRLAPPVVDADAGIRPYQRAA